MDNALTDLDQEITRQTPESGRAQTFRPASRVGPGLGTAPDWFSQVPQKISAPAEGGRDGRVSLDLAPQRPQNASGVTRAETA